MMARGVCTRTWVSHGAHLTPGDVLFLAPPLVVTEEEIDRLLSAVHDAAEAVAAAVC